MKQVKTKVKAKVPLATATAYAISTDKPKRFPSAVLIAVVLSISAAFGILALTGKMFQQQADATATATANSPPVCFYKPKED